MLRGSLLALGLAAGLSRAQPGLPTVAVLPLSVTSSDSASGGAYAEVLGDEGKGVRLKRHGIYDEYALIAPPTHLYAHYRLDGPGIREVAEEFLRGGRA